MAVNRTRKDAIVYARDVEGPCTHVLIVGVGHYPYFAGGGPKANPLVPLGQLTSSPCSARAFADWFIGTYNYPPAPLGTVALMTSERRTGPYQSPHATWKLIRPTYSAFADAVHAWKSRGDTDEGNRLIFIFCGHGYGYGPEASLLMADFDFAKPNRWDDALDLSAFHTAMEQCAAAEQLFFIDACRRPHGELVVPGARAGRNPVHPVPNARAGFTMRRNAPLVFSTGDAQPALGRTDQASVFTESFMKAVAGMGARNDEDDWRITNNAMLEAMSHVSKRLTALDFAEPQQPMGGEARPYVFHMLEGDPVSSIYLRRAGEIPCGPGELRFQLAGRTMARPCTVDEHEVELSLPYGAYTFTLHSGGQQVASATKEVSPIYKKATLS